MLYNSFGGANTENKSIRVPLENSELETVAVAWLSNAIILHCLQC